MNNTALSRRLVALEIARATAQVRLATQEFEAASARYEASLYRPEEPDPRHDAYLTGQSFVEFAAD